MSEPAANSVSLIYITAPNREQGLVLARTLVEQRLLACANLLPGVRSVYRWQGVVQEDDEVVIIGKTRSALVGAVRDRVCALHSYDCPCVVAVPVTGGHDAFLAWVSAETGTPEDQMPEGETTHDINVR